jgi:hypothetical protein
MDFWWHWRGYSYFILCALYLLQRFYLIEAQSCTQNTFATQQLHNNLKITSMSLHLQGFLVVLDHPIVHIFLSNNVSMPKGISILDQRQGSWNDQSMVHLDTFIQGMNDSKTCEIRWSKWVELMRKELECTFGIMNRLWHIFNSVTVAYDILTLMDS